MHPQGISLQQTGNGWLVQIPTKHRGPVNFPFDMEAMGEIVATAQGNGPDPLIAGLQREQKEKDKAQTFDAMACMVPGAYHFGNIEKAILFIMTIVQDEDIDKALAICDPTYRK